MEIGNTTIKSYIIYDLETTTLPCFGNPKIIEISAISVIRDHIEKNCSHGELPRVVNKLTLCVYPRRRIPLEAERITGLSNLLLEDQSPFNEKIFNILSDFIDRMPQPACLIAHNGNRFDFPILQAEVQGLGKKFPDDLWCADSLNAFRFLYSEKLSRRLSMSCQEKKSSKTLDRNLESMLKDSEEFDTVLCEALDSVEQTVLSQGMERNGVHDLEKEEFPVQCSFDTEMIASENFVESTTFLYTPSSVLETQKVNETTPKRPSLPANKKPIPKVVKCDDMFTPDLSASVKSKRSKNGPVKCLIDEFSGITSPKSFKLGHIYQFLCDQEPINAHSAEGDSTMLLHCIIASRNRFLDWVDKNAILFNSVQKMW